MMIKIIFVISILLISGCVSTPGKKVDAPVLEEEVLEAKLDVADTYDKHDLKAASFEPEVLYLLLTAELAGQKGLYKTALEGYMRAAEKVSDPRIAERAAKVALFLKDYDQAKKAIGLWLKNDADNLMARKVAVMLALKNAEKDAAIEHLNILLNSDPAGFEIALLEIVKSLEREGGVDIVYGVLEELSVIHPEQAAILFVQALLSVQQNESERALKKIQKTLELQPDWNKAIMLQAQIVSTLGDVERAEEILNQAISKRPDNTQLKVILARVLVRARKYELAVDVFEQVIEQSPEDLDSQYALALVYQQMQQDEMAREVFLGLLNRPGWSDRVSFHLGRLDADKGEFARARVWFDKITQKPYLFDAKMATVGLMLDQKQYQKAEQFVSELDFEDQFQELRLILIKAELLGKQKRNQEAYDLLTATLQQRPKQKDLLYTRALIAEDMGRIDVLENDLQAILDEDPDNASALNALGYTLAERDERLDEAEGYLDRAMALEPNDPIIIDSYGWLLFRQGQLKRSLEYLQKAYEQEQEAEIAGHLVEVLWGLERKNEARDVYQEALQKFNDDEYLLRLKKQINGLSED